MCVCERQFWRSCSGEMSNVSMFPTVLHFILQLCISTCCSLMYVWSRTSSQFLISFALSLSHLHSRKINLGFKVSRIRAALAGGKCQGAFCLNDYWQKDLWSRKQFKKKRAILLSVCVAASLRQSAIISKHESMNTPRKQTNNSMRRVC